MLLLVPSMRLLREASNMEMAIAVAEFAIAAYVAFLLVKKLG